MARNLFPWVPEANHPMAKKSSNSDSFTRAMREANPSGSVETLHIIFGDQLDIDAPVFDYLDPENDAILMMEVAGESTHVPSHRQRTVLFLSAMRHFAVELAERNWRIRYIQLGDRGNTQSFESEIKRAIKALKPNKLQCLLPGEWRVLQTIRKIAKSEKLNLHIEEDTHFLCSPDEFREWAKDRKSLVMEFFYREMRKKLGVLVDKEGRPRGGDWNYDKENRKPFGKETPERKKPRRFRPDEITRQVIADVEKKLGDLPGEMVHFQWPVTRMEALACLKDFIEHRLPHFGDWQDAIAADEPFMFHSLLSPALNLKLLDPRECIEAALDALKSEKAPLNAVEGFIRQIIGWREFIRGVYWLEGEEYGDRNELNQTGKLPRFYWDGETEMACMSDCLSQVIEHGYGHHIQRLMVTGNFALIAGVHPRAISDWYLGMYVDAIDWVTLPNTLGMVMHADGGVVGTKPYAASGNYIKKMGNYCEGCACDPKKRTGENACPFTVFFWDFLSRNQKRFKENPRMKFMMANLARIPTEELKDIHKRARELRSNMGIGEID